DLGVVVRRQEQKLRERRVRPLAGAYRVDVRLAHAQVAIQVGVAGVPVPISIGVPTRRIASEDAVVEGVRPTVAIPIAHVVVGVRSDTPGGADLEPRDTEAGESGREREEGAVSRVPGERYLRGIELPDD